MEITDVKIAVQALEMNSLIDGGRMKNQKGQSMIEFIFILPVFLFIFVVLVSICEFTLSYMWVDYQLYRAALCLDHSTKFTCLTKFNITTNDQLFNMTAASLPGDFKKTDYEIHVKTKLFYQIGFFKVFQELNFYGILDSLDNFRIFVIEKKYFYPIMRNL